MGVCTHPQRPPRDGTRAAARRSHRSSVRELLLWLLVAAAAAVPAYAGESGDTSPLCVDIFCYTASQMIATTTAFAALASSMTGLVDWWGFDDSTNFCRYKGVTCRQAGITVNASSLGLRGSLPEVADSKAYDSMLTTLDLHGNPGVAGTVPASWSKYTRLRRVRVSETSVSGPLPAAWSTLPQLYSIEFQHTRLSSMLPDSWSGMTQLEVLVLNGTLVYGTIPESWGALTSLRMLDLSGTSVTGCLPKAWVDAHGWTEAGVGLTSESSSNCTVTEKRHIGGTHTWVIVVAVACSVVGAVLLSLFGWFLCCWCAPPPADLQCLDSRPSAGAPPTRATRSPNSAAERAAVSTPEHRGVSASSISSAASAAGSVGGAAQQMRQCATSMSAAASRSADDAPAAAVEAWDESRYCFWGVEAEGNEAPPVPYAVSATSGCGGGAEAESVVVPCVNPLDGGSSRREAAVVAVWHATPDALDSAGGAGDESAARTVPTARSSTRGTSLPRCATRVKRLSRRGGDVGELRAAPRAAPPQRSLPSDGPASAPPAPAETLMSLDRWRVLFEMQKRETADPLFGVFVEDSSCAPVGDVGRAPVARCAL